MRSSPDLAIPDAFLSAPLPLLLLPDALRPLCLLIRWVDLKVPKGEMKTRTRSRIFHAFCSLFLSYSPYQLSRHILLLLTSSYDNHVPSPFLS
jgi:hypothetical protein